MKEAWLKGVRRSHTKSMWGLSSLHHTLFSPAVFSILITHSVFIPFFTPHLLPFISSLFIFLEPHCRHQQEQAEALLTFKINRGQKRMGLLRIVKNQVQPECTSKCPGVTHFHLNFAPCWDDVTID